MREPYILRACFIFMLRKDKHRSVLLLVLGLLIAAYHKNDAHGMNLLTHCKNTTKIASYFAKTLDISLKFSFTIT